MSKTSKKNTILSLVCWLLVLLLSGQTALCSDRDASSFIGEVNATLEDPLPKISTILPKYRRPEKEPPGLVVAKIKYDRESSMPWGDAIGRILRRKLMASPKIQLLVPNLYTLRSDAWTHGMDDRDILFSLDSIKLIHRRYGIDTALTGSILMREDQYDLNLQLIKLPSGDIKRKFHVSGKQTDLPKGLGNVSVQIYDALGVPLDKSHRDFLLMPTPATFTDLYNFVMALGNLKNLHTEQAAMTLKPFLGNKVFLPAAVALYLSYLDPGSDPYAYLKRLDEGGRGFYPDGGLQLLIIQLVGGQASGKLLDMMIYRLHNLIMVNPYDPTAMILFGSFLSTANRDLESIAFHEEVLLRWPDNFRAWWGMSYALNRYASNLRGISFWDDVPAKGKRLWGPLNDLADKAANKALELNPDNSDLWVLKMRTKPGYSDEMMQSFYKAIKLEPHNKYAYMNALNFTLPQWGGSYDIQQRVWDLMLKNNPNASWLDELRRDFKKDLPRGY